MKKQDKQTKADSKIIPLGDRVLVQEIPKEDKKTASGIIIPESVKSDKAGKRGLIVAVGKGKYEDGKLVPMSVSAGDTVIYGWGDEIIVDGAEYSLVRESEIMAIIK